MACYITPTTKAHAEQFFSCMLLVLWPNYGLCGGSDGTEREGKRKAAVVLVLLAKDVVSLQINTEIGKS